MWKIIFWYSIIGGVLLILSRLFGSSLYYLSGYLYILSYIVIVPFIVITGKRMSINLNGFDYLKIIFGVFVGMTLIYVIFILLKNKFFI